MEIEGDVREVNATGAQLLPDGRRGIRIHGWEIETFHRPCLTFLNVQLWESKLGTSHLPEMVFGESCLVLKHSSSGSKIHFNAFDTLMGWKKEALPAVEVPAAAKWKNRSLMEKKSRKREIVLFIGRTVKRKLMYPLWHQMSLFSSMMRLSCTKMNCQIMALHF